MLPRSMAQVRCADMGVCRGVRQYKGHRRVRPGLALSRPDLPYLGLRRLPRFRLASRDAADLLHLKLRTTGLRPKSYRAGAGGPSADWVDPFEERPPWRPNLSPWVVVAAAVAILTAVTTLLVARNPSTGGSDALTALAVVCGHALQALQPLGSFASQLPGHMQVAWQHIWLWLSSSPLLANLAPAQHFPPAAATVAALALSAAAVVATAWYIKKQQPPDTPRRISTSPTPPTSSSNNSSSSSRSSSPLGTQQITQTTPTTLEQQLQAQQQFSQRLMGELQQINAVFQQLGAQIPPPGATGSPADLAGSGIPPLVLEVRARLGSLSRLLQEKSTLLQQMSSWSELQVCVQKTSHRRGY